jgi:hypothetical protein
MRRDNDEALAHCPSCLAEYWKAQYEQLRAENAELLDVIGALLSEIIYARDVHEDLMTPQLERIEAQAMKALNNE